MNIISFDDFQKIEIRVGKVIKVDQFPEARKPALKLKIDFGETIGIKKSSAQITHHSVSYTHLTLPTILLV